MKRLPTCLASALYLLGASGCAAAQQPAIYDFDSTQPLTRAEREDLRESSAMRWSITIYEGRGIPGTPTANIVIPDALNVLQGIVDECELGPTTLFHHTDGVARLEIEDTRLTNEQTDCIRRHERPGLFLEDPRNGPVTDSMESIS